VPRAQLIFNPIASRTDTRIVGRVVDEFLREGWDLDIAGTTREGHASELARQGVKDGADLIAVYGGDGTTTQAMEGVVGSDTPVAIIPGGTGNLLAGNLRVPRNARAAARAAIRGTPRPIDLGRMQCNGGDRYFAVGAGTGIDADIMAQTTTRAKRKWGMGAYVARGLELLGAPNVVPHRITIDGKTFETDALMVLAANCGEIIPPVVRLKWGISFDDGLFDVLVINAGTFVETMDAAWRMITGLGHGGKRVAFFSGKSVTVETETPRPVQMDGELCGETPFSAEIVPAAIRIVVPGDWKAPVKGGMHA
jgi:YegS/Rv2252/BmrU family lipid kinase